MVVENEAHEPAGETLEITVERILPGGLGLAHAGGQTVMVALAAPGDRLRVAIDRVKGSVAFASIKEIVEPSSLRVEPPCPYFGRCGGCDFQQLDYRAQLSAKTEIIRDCLRRIGGLNQIPDLEITPAPSEWHYRARAQWQYDPERRALGYFESASRRVCDVSECAVLVPELQDELQALRVQMDQGTLRDDARYFRAIAGDKEVAVVDDQGRNPSVTEGAVHTTRAIENEQYRFSAESFFQTNIDLLPELIDVAIGGARGQTAVELYCGVGLFTVPLARRFERVVAVEGDAPAATFARDNLAAAGLQNAEVFSGNVADWLENAGASGFDSKPDFLLLDPPRVGAESRVIAGILRAQPKAICYVSCDPATLARDLKKLIAGGYSIDRMAAFDMFPQTHHVETIVHLTG